MKKLLVLAAASLILLTACAPKEGIEVRDAWARAAAPGENGAVYFVIHNYSAADDSLVGASTDAAEKVEIHESSMAGDVMEMHMLPAVLLPAGEDVEFSTGGLHLMLFNLQRELKIGESIEITLHFQTSADIPVTAHVQAGPEQDDD
jgi:copper(I)-binding protein